MTKEAATQYTVKDVAEAVGLQEASVRVGLRDSDFEREGRSWTWSTKKAFDEVCKFFKDRSDRRPDLTPMSDKAKDKAPAKDAKKADAKADKKAEAKKADAKGGDKKPAKKSK